MTLEQQIAARAKEIHTDGYPMSIGEVLSLYRDGDIDIHPEFQRIFRWDDNQKSRLVESILLGIPIPAIFVSQRDDGIWDVIDGVQRLSTIFEFVGVYRDHNNQLLPPTTLRETEYLPDLAGYRWEVSGPAGRVFTDAMRRDFKRAKLDFRIIRKESDENAKYDMFQRLNSGTELSPQEARNCLLVMLNPRMFDELASLAESSDFQNAVPLSDQKKVEAYRQELVLRFFCQADFGSGDTEMREEYGDYLTRWMRSAAKDYGTRESKIAPELFRRTFRVLNLALGEDAFRRFDGDRHLGPFSIASFEFVTSGVAAHIDKWEQSPPAELRARVEQVWTAREFRDNSGTGVSPRRRVPRLVNRSREFFGR
ncbi:DUF262 domain-containing protein [Micromonospora citrea]|uniref:DUF262 domain-containing protein n=1 Tax=Micromonospora citrea TaxID=47855 RepID=UPI003C5F7944